MLTLDDEQYKILQGLKGMGKKCELTHCVNNVNGCCHSRASNWVGVCRFKRKL